MAAERSGIPQAAGAAYSARIRGTDQVALAFFGDGAVNIGSFHAGLNLASVWRLGAAFVPEERLGHGTAPRMKLSENALLTGHAASGMVSHGFVDRGVMLDTVDRTTKTLDVRKAKRDPAAVSLSGGNLQKFVVGREILREPGVLVVAQPTWGVDAGAAAVIRQALIDLAGRGAAVLVISQDLDELEEIADRITVLGDGKTIARGAPMADMTRQTLVSLMIGRAERVAQIAERDDLTPSDRQAILSDNPGRLFGGS